MLGPIEFIREACARLDAAVPSLKEELCLRNRYRASRCELCEKVCPRQAMEAGNGPKEDRCTGCGLCELVCPAGALTLQMPSFLELCSQTAGAARAAHRCLFVCSRCRDKPAGAVQVQCLARCDEVVLLTAAAHGAGEIWLQTRPCRDCPQGKDCLAFLQEQIGLFTERLAAFGHGCPVRLDLEGWTREGGGAASPEISRREFLLSLRKGSGRLLGQIAGEMEEVLQVEEVPKPGLKAPKHLPPRQKAAAQAVQGLASGGQKPGKVAGLFSGLQVESSCHGCGACADICPTGALEIHEEGGMRRLLHRASACTGCGLCKEICPQGSLCLLEEVPLEEVLGGERILWVRTAGEQEKLLGSMENKMAALLGCRVKKN